MKRLDTLLKEKERLTDSLEKLQKRIRVLEKEIEQTRMREVFEEATKNGCTNAEDLRKLIISSQKKNEAIIAGNGGTNE